MEDHEELSRPLLFPSPGSPDLPSLEPLGPSLGPGISYDHGEPDLNPGDSVYLLLLGRLLAIAASMTAASLVPSLASQGELHGGPEPVSGDRSFFGFVDSLLSGSHSEELSEAMFGDEGGHSFLRIFRFPQEDTGLTPVLIIGVRAAAAHSDQDDDQDNFPAPLFDSDTVSIHSDSSSAGATATMDAPAAHQSWVIYVVGTAFPPSHEIFSDASFQTNSPSIEGILALESLLGNPQSLQTATKSQMRDAGGLCDATEEHLQDSCSICLQNYEIGDQMRALGCKHAYHRGCVDEWLTGSHNSCPICRKVAV